MKSDERILKLPQPIIDRLRQVIRRIRRLQWIKGSLYTLAAAVGAVLAVMALDAAFSLESAALRLALSLSGLGLVLRVAWTRWVRPLTRRISLSAVARWVETRHPELQERISTAVELLDARHGADDLGSEELLAAVVREAVEDAGKVDPEQELSAKRTLPAKWLAGTALSVLGALLAIWPGQTPRLLARAIAPLADVGNAWADRLRVITQSQTLAVGDPLSIEVGLRGPAARVELLLTTGDGKTMVEMLSPDAAVPLREGESGYALRMPSVEEGFTARVVAGKAVSAAFTVKAVPRPEPGSLTITYHYPEYTGLPEEVRENVSGEILALAGTMVEVRAPLNRPVSRAVVKIGGLEVPDVRLAGDSPVSSVIWTTTLTANQDALWSLHLEDADGITNRPVDLPIKSLPDLPPVITLDTPVEDRLELRPVEKLALTYSVREDIGLSAVQIRIRPQDKPEYLVAAGAPPEKTEDSESLFRGTAVLDLARVLVPDGQEIRVSLMAADRLPAEMQGPQRAYSREIVIRLNRWTQPLIEKNFQAQHQELRKKMEEVKQELYSAKGRMNDKPDRLKHDDKLDKNVLSDLETGAAHMADAQELLEDLASRMKETAFARQTPDLQEIAEAMVQPAKAKAQDIPLTDGKEARSELAKSSRDLLDHAIQKLEEEQRQLDEDRQQVQQIAKLSDIAEQQQRLAAEAAATAGPPPEASPATGNDSPPESAQQPPPAGTEQAANPANDPSAADAAQKTPPGPEDEKKWLEEQRQVAERAKQLMQENQNSNPQGLQDQLEQAGEQAARLAEEAAALSEKENSLAGEMSAAATAEQQQQAAAAQGELTRQIADLQEKATGFQQQSARQIDQTTDTQETAIQAQSSLTEATGQARQSGEELAAAQEAAAAGEQESKAQDGPDKSGGPEQTATETASSQGTPENRADSQEPAAAGTAEASPASSPGEGTPSAGKGQEPGTPSPLTAESGESSAGAPETPPVPAVAGRQPALASAQSLAAAAESLKSLGRELSTLAGMVADHSESLGEGARQAGTAADQARQAQQQGEQNSGMQQGAGAAQQAADRLAMAANTAMQAMSIPASAKDSQASGQAQNRGKPRSGQPNPSPPGQEGKDGLQADTANGLLPPELARLGLTEDDWMKLRSVLNGVDGVRNDQVPEEYRELVKAYFGALAKGGNQP